MSKQDRQGVRNAVDLERKYAFERRFAEVYGLSMDAQKAAEVAQEAANRANDAYAGLNQEEIFNILTNNGEEQGIYRQDGKIYINANYLKSGTVNADLVKAGTITSEDGSIKIDLVSNKIEVGEGSGARPAWDSKIELDAFGVAGYGKNYSTGEFEETLQIRPGLHYRAGSTILNTIKSLSGVGLSIGTDGGTFSLGDPSADTKIYGSSITAYGAMQTNSINPGKTKLFTGNVTRGNTCTVPNTDRYDLFAIKLGDSATNTFDTVVLAYKTGNVVRGIGGWAGTETESKQLFFFSATISGNTWTLQDAGYHYVYIGGTVEEGIRLNLKEVIGVI